MVDQVPCGQPHEFVHRAGDAWVQAAVEQHPAGFRHDAVFLVGPEAIVEQELAEVARRRVEELATVGEIAPLQHSRVERHRVAQQEVLAPVGGEQVG